jgi:hypothetical protein
MTAIGNCYSLAEQDGATAVKQNERCRSKFLLNAGRGKQTPNSTLPALGEGYKLSAGGREALKAHTPPSPTTKFIHTGDPTQLRYFLPPYCRLTKMVFGFGKKRLPDLPERQLVWRCSYCETKNHYEKPVCRNCFQEPTLAVRSQLFTSRRLDY